MKRRQFLKVAGAGTAVVALPAAAFAARGVHGAAAAILHRELHYLQLEPTGVARFVEEYFADATLQQELRVRMLSLLRKPAEESWQVGDLVKQYLMGSDFFTTDMNESRQVNYIGLYGPYARPCQHPFSAAFYPDADLPDQA